MYVWDETDPELDCIFRSLHLPACKILHVKGEKLNYKSVAKEISKPPSFLLLKSGGHQRL